MNDYEESWNTIEDILDISKEGARLKRMCKIAHDHAWRHQQININELKKEMEETK